MKFKYIKSKQAVLITGFRRLMIVFFLCVPIYIYFSIARFDPDPHHDGIQLAPAIGILNGKQLHGELFEQYGPVWVWIKSVFLYYFGAKLEVLRLLAAFIAVLTTFMIFFACSKITKMKIVGLMMSAAYLFTNPSFNTINGMELPLWLWPSLFINLIFLIMVSILISDISTRSKRFEKVAAIFLGFLLTIVLFTRFQIGVLAIIGISYFLISRRKYSLEFLGFYFSSLLTFSGGVVVYLIVTNSFNYFILQIIIGPATNLIVMLKLYIDVPDLFVNFGIGVLPALFVFYANFYLFNRSKIVKKLTLLLSGIFIFVLIIWGKFTGLSPLNNISLVQEVLDMQSHLILYASFSFALFVLFFHRLLLRNKKVIHNMESTGFEFDNPEESLRVLMFFSSLALVQLYPRPDVYHLWWASPILLIAFPYFLMMIGFRREILVTSLLTLVIPITLVGMYSFVEQIQIPRTVWISGILEGMLVQDSRLKDFYIADNIFSENKHALGIYNCNDALFPVWNGKYQASDGKYVSWAWGTANNDQISSGMPVYLCSNDPVYPREWAETNNLGAPIKVTPQLNLSEWSTPTLYYFRRE